MEQQVGRLVAECIESSGLTARQVAVRAGVSASTVHRILNGQVSPSVATLHNITAACGLDLAMSTPVLSSAEAAAAARAILDENYPAEVAPDIELWATRLEAWAENDPVQIIEEAARASGVLHRADAVLLAGETTAGRLASAGEASGKQWALSGAAGLDLPAFDEAVARISVLWCEDPNAVLPHVVGGSLRQTSSAHRASVVVAAADPDLFRGTFERDRIRYAAPIQIALDAISVGGDAAARAREEIRTW
ncbi:transcriptional regulator with XRE-family HTH domain [Nocardioides luteus]|uniref:helix-turn-helix domain-containing protein n=1 Tax=Nocardioides luteus TaxID=1844 RepID=UPI0016668883|nr:helix-turn-helix transcriptional regulator [Nocardioides luteus]MDR7313723.1 transcriptional regulator with XRE-family HTH domain [Nocardioides luteus]